MTTSHHFGKGIDTSIFTPNRTTSMGDSIGCIGHNKHNTKAQWFGYINNGTRIDPHSLTFCNFCAKNYFTSEQVFEVLDTDYRRFGKQRWSGLVMQTRTSITSSSQSSCCRTRADEITCLPEGGNPILRATSQANKYSPSPYAIAAR